MSRVEEIIAALLAADAGIVGADSHRWAAAQGIWEELDEGKTQRTLAVEIGKSQAYVFRYARCWKLVREVHDEGTPLPPFAEVLNSNEVRGESHERFKSDEDRGSDHANPPVFTPPDPRQGIATWIASADEALELIAEHRIAWQFLTAEDLYVLRGLRHKVDNLVEALGSSQGRPSV